MLSVTEKGQPIADSVKLQRLRQILFSLMDSHGEGIVNIKRVRLLPPSHPNNILRSSKVTCRLCLTCHAL